MSNAHGAAGMAANNTAKLVELFGADETVQPFQDWITKDAHGVMILLCR